MGPPVSGALQSFYLFLIHRFGFLFLVGSSVGEFSFYGKRNSDLSMLIRPHFVGFGCMRHSVEENPSSVY